MKTRIKIIVCALVFAIALSVGAVVALGNEEPSVTVEKYNLTFEDTVYLTYAVRFDNLPDGAEKGILAWDKPQESYTVNTPGYTKITEHTTTINFGNGLCHVYDYQGIAAKELTDEVYIVGYIKDGDKYTYSELSKYSVLQYAYSKLGYTGAPTQNQSFAELIQAMLEYGAEAQKYFNYRADNLPTDKYYMVNLSGGTLPDKASFGLYKEGVNVTASAPSTDSEGKLFAGWMNEDGNYISFNPTVSYNVPGRNSVIKAVYTDNNLNYILNGGALSDGYAENYDPTAPTKLPVPTKEGFVFAGWYTTETFEPGTRTAEIAPGTSGVVTVFAKWQNDIAMEDFTGDTFSSDSTKNGSATYIIFKTKDKTGTTSKAVKDANGNTYVVFKSSEDGDTQADTTNFNLHEKAALGGGKITFTVDLAMIDANTAGASTNFRIRGNSFSDVITLFTTDTSGNVMLAGKTAFASVSQEFTTIAVTLDASLGKVTAYDVYGTELATSSVRVPDATAQTYATVTEWLDATQTAINWYYANVNGGFKIDNFHVYAGDYIVPQEALSKDYPSISYVTNGGILPSDALGYYDPEAGGTLSAPTKEGYVFSGWYTSEDFAAGTRIEKISAGSTKDYTLYANWSKIVFENNFNKSNFTLSAESTGNKAYDGITYDNKSGVLSTAVVNDGGYYVKVSTSSANDASINRNITEGDLAGIDKLTFEIDLAKIKDTGTTAFRMRVGGSSDIIPIFNTSGTTVNIGNTSIKIADLSENEFTKLAITLDVAAGLLTAYREGAMPVFSAVSVPAASAEASLADWIAKVKYLFNWHMSKDGGVAFDNICIYSGDYIGARDISEEEREVINEQIKTEIDSFEYDESHGIGEHTRLDDASVWSASEIDKYNSFTNALEATPTEDTHPRLMLNADTLADIIKVYNDPDYTRFKALLYNTARMETDGKLPAAVEHTSGRQGIHNYDANILYALEAKALMYLITGDELYGYDAIRGIKNYLNTLDIKYVHSDQCREYGSVMFVAAEVYDWCYDLLTAKDKDQIATGVEYLICRGTMAGTEYSGMCGGSTDYDKYMEVGFPPAGQGSVSGHGSEAQILRDYLAIAIAIYDEDPTWYNYIAGRVYKDYVAFRNIYYTTDLYPQGTGCYANHRFPADLYSAWILEQMPGGANPYIDNMQNIAASLLGHNRPDGNMFVTGDGAATTLNTAIVLMTGALYNDPALYTYGISMISPSIGSSALTIAQIMILASRDTDENASLNKAGDLFDSLSPVTYNGSYVGQIISRSEWNNPDAPAAFMKIGERSTANHEHADAGTFQIYYKGMLTGDTGIYAGYGTNHHKYYHKATVSHNGLLIYNPAKANSENVFAYSGGQNVPASEASTLDVWSGNDAAYKTGEVLGYEYGFKDADGKKTDYAYISGDIAAAYAYADAVSYVGRSMLTVYTDDTDVPMIFVTFDRITATDALFEKTYLLHTVNEPTIVGNKVTVDNGKGKLVFTSLTDAEISKDGGAGRGFLVNGVQCAASTGKDDSNWGRVELKTSGALTSNFFNVMYVTDSDSAAELAVSKITASGVEAARAGDYVFGFVNSEERRSHDVTLTAGESGKSIEYFVGGLAAGTWQVKVGGSVVTTVTVTEEGGLAHFEATGASVTLTRTGS